MVDAQQLAVLSFQPNFCDQMSLTDFPHLAENPRKFVEKQKDDNFILLHFHVYLDTSKDDYPKNVCPRRLFAQGEFLAKKIFPQEAFVQERPSLPRRLFVQEDVYPFGTIVQRHLCNKGHPMAKYVVWSRVLTKQKSDTW